MNQKIRQFMNQRLLLATGVILTVGLLIYLGFFNTKPEQPEMEEDHHDEISEVMQLSPTAVRQSGITTTVVQSRNVSNQITTTGEVKANENRVFHINSFVGGRVVQDNVSLGDTVRQGQTLAVVQNLEVAKVQAGFIHELHQNEIEIEKAKSRYALAQKNLEREKRLLAEGISPRKDYQQAQADAEIARAELEGEKEHAVHIKAEARSLLGAYGVKPGSIHSERIRNTSPVLAPRSGVITKKNITVGDVVTSEDVLYEVGDLSQVWLDVAVYPKDLANARQGQSVTFTTDSLPNMQFTGQIDYVQPAVNEQSQTFTARTHLSNPGGLLKAGMFGKATIQQSGQVTRPYVSEEAVQRYGKETFVFKVIGPNRFRKQTVQLGEKVGAGYLVNSGLELGETVVGKGSFTLKAEMLKSQFGDEGHH